MDTRKIKEIPELELKEILTKYFKTFMLDIDQNTTQEKFIHLVNRVYEILIKFHSSLTLPELENVLQSGMNEGFGAFKKLTVQTIREWLFVRQKEMFEKRYSKEKVAEQKRESNKEYKSIYSSVLGKIVGLKQDMYRTDAIREDVYDKWTCKKLYEKFPNAKISEIRQFLLDENEKSETIDLLEDIEIEDLPIEFENNENF